MARLIAGQMKTSQKETQDKHPQCTAEPPNHQK